MYTYDEAFKDTLKYFDGDDLAAKVWVDKYSLRDNEGNILEKTPTDMHWRLAKEFARIQKQKYKKPMSEQEIFNLFDRFSKIIPQGSPMYGIGNPYQYVSIGNCFVLPPPDDSYSSITYLDSQIVAIASRRGGTGWHISKLRPIGMPVKNAAKTTSGAVSFMNRFSNTIREVGMFGRRGASLQAISVHHPDILDFISIKRDLNSVTGSNITVQLTDEFMNAVEKDLEFELRWPVSKEDAKELNVNFPVISKMVKAKDIWKEFIIGARDYAEPGACYIDTVHRESTGYFHGHKESSSNPCGEQYLPAYASCRLIVQLLLSYVVNAYQKNSYFDFNSFYNDCYTMQKLADDMVDLEIEAIDKIINKIKSDPEPKHIKQISIDLWKNVKETSIKDRRTGCGFTALGDTLAALNIKYGSEESIKFCEEMQRTFKFAAYRASIDMAKELGSFENYNFENDIKSTFIQRFENESCLIEDGKSLLKDMKKYGRRNMVLLTLAPTGSVSCLTRTTSGIEPVFKLEYTRRKKGNPGDKDFRTDFVDQNGDHWQEFNVKHKGLQDWININQNNDITKSPYYKCTANDIDWTKKIKMQSVLQKHIDNSISVTTNLPENIGYDKVSEMYLEAWRLGCKGFTVYRDKSRTGVLIDKKETIDDRPKELKCDVHHITIKGQQYFVFVGLDNDNNPFEVFAGKNGIIPKNIKTGKIIKRKKDFYKIEFDDSDIELSPITASMDEIEEIISRFTSGLLRSGADMYFIVRQLEKVGARQSDLNSFAKGLSRALKTYIKDGTKDIGEKCPECKKEEIYRQEGCKVCKNCGFSACN